MKNQINVQKIIFPFLCLSLVVLSLAFVSPVKNNSKAATAASINNADNAVVTLPGKEDHTAAALELTQSLSQRLKPASKGISGAALNSAIKGYLHLRENGMLRNPDLLSIVDFSQSSRKKRFYLIDLKKQDLLLNTYVAHGKNTGVDMANSFSNIIGSEKSSLGFYVTKGTYTGKNGFSLRMEGLDKGFNDNAEKRAIVVHGADYVNAARAQSAYMGRSQGCPALPKEDYTKVINLIKEGSALFVYYPSTSYLNNSAILNS